MSYSADLSTVYRQATHLVDGLLRGAKADDLPVEQATRFELVTNLKTAKALGRFRKRCARVDVVIRAAIPDSRHVRKRSMPVVRV
jgi:ABC-type uncharacterized transport system substrate-binding protein